jgi:hypothetical protein
MTHLTRMTSSAIALVSVLTVPTAANGQGRFAVPGPLARAAARMTDALAVGQPLVDQRWINAMTLPAPGVDLRIELDRATLRGAFVSAEADSLTLQVEGMHRRVTRHEVRRVAMAAGTRQRRHETIGLLAGGVLGAVIMNRRCRGQSLSSACWEEAMLYLGGPMFAGGIIGHVLPAGVAWRDIYIRRRALQ